MVEAKYKGKTGETIKGCVYKERYILKRDTR